jgi:uncharacterized surface anchored protein
MSLATTGANGRFRIPSLAPGDIVVQLAAQHGVAAPVVSTLTEGVTTTLEDCKLCNGVELDITVIDSATNKPLSSASLQLKSSNPTLNTSALHTDATGHLHLHRIIPGTYELTATANSQANSAPHHKLTVTVVDGETKQITIPVSTTAAPNTKTP